MTTSPRVYILVLLTLTLALISAQSLPLLAADNPSASMQKKLDHIAQNGRKAQPDQTPTILSETEVNDYFATGHVKLPQGVDRVRFHIEPGIIIGTARVDFDVIRAGQKSSNPLMNVFTGLHDVRVIADAEGSGGTGRVDVQSVTIDGVQIPRMALEFFVNKYIKPKYPNVGLVSEFKMPSRIDIAKVDDHQVVVTQK